MKITLCLLLTVCIQSKLFGQTDLVKAKVSFESMKLKSYDNCVKETKEFLIVWVNFEDLKAYSEFSKSQKTSIKHCYCDEFPGIKSGVVVGKKTNNVFQRILDVQSSEGVILKVSQALGVAVSRPFWPSQSHPLWHQSQPEWSSTRTTLVQNVEPYKIFTIPYYSEDSVMPYFPQQGNIRTNAPTPFVIQSGITSKSTKSNCST